MPDRLVLPGSTLGILGGGQLGRMMAIEAKKMGYDVICLDPDPNSPCGQVADDQIVAPLNDHESADRLAQKCDVVLYEFENIDVLIVEELEKRYYLPQGSKILSIAQDRIKEKTEIQRAGFPVVPFRVINNQGDLEAAVRGLGYPCVLKTSRGGYDGKGQLVLKSPGDLGQARDMLDVPGMKWVLEKMVTFTHEASAIVARNQRGEVKVFPVAENIHRDNILFISIVPARIDSVVEKEISKLARELAIALGLVGLLAIEFFITTEGIVVNEIAPRPHNSGHYTWDACYVSQFEQIIRCVCGLPLGTTELMSPVVMVNILGADLAPVLKELPNFPDNVKLHLYGKRGTPVPKRKLGHLTVKTSEPVEAIDWVKSFYPV